MVANVRQTSTVIASTNVNLKLNAKKALAFWQSFASLYRAGVPLNRIVSQICELTTDQKFRAALNDVAERLNKGELFSNALARYPKVFGSIAIALVGVAEATGNWTAGSNGQLGILDLILKYLKRNLKVDQSVKAGLLYPAIIILAVIGAVIAFVTFILPRIREFFTVLTPNSNPGMIAMVFFWTADFIKDYWWTIPIAISGIAFLAWQFITSPQGKNLWHKYQLKMKVPAPIFINLNIAKTFYLLGTLLSAGITAQQSLKICSESVGNGEISIAIGIAMDRFYKGKPLSDVLRDCHLIFQGEPYQVLKVGEEGGTLDTGLIDYAEQLFDRVDEEIEQAVKLIEPAMLVVAGSIVGFFVIGFYGSLSQLIGNLAR
ncbi:MAG: type II secretion system F family protein [Acidobacteriota bacterium]